MKVNNIIFKVLLLVWAMGCALFAKAQEPCEITCNTEMPICSESPVTLSVPNNYQYSFTWSPGGQTTNLITVRPRQTTTYRVMIRDKETDTLICESEGFTVEVMPRYDIKFRQMKLTCSNREEENGRNAQAIAWVDPNSNVYAKPFDYHWDVSPLHVAPGCDSLAIGLEAFRFYKITVTDGRGCVQRDSVKLKAYPNPLIEIGTDPGDTVYLQNPHMTYSFENLSADTLPLSNFYWILNSTYNDVDGGRTPFHLRGDRQLYHRAEGV